MSFLKLLGFLDLLSIIVLLLFKYNFVSKFVLLIALFYILGKAIIFFRDFASLVDFGVVIVFALALYGIYGIITWLAVIWILQKSIFSFLS